MTYNVKGLPWPFAQGRPAALAAIGQKLRQLRLSGLQPHVVVLQEAFIPAAKDIARIAGYRFVAIGPQPPDSKTGETSALGRKFIENASWTKGETEGKWLDSGLVTLSDYPIEKTAKMAFPLEECAGFDCLASKGVLITWIRPEESDEPIAIVNTHLNSRGASGVTTQRANTAYARQFVSLTKFIDRKVGTGKPLILSGDLNVGQDKSRMHSLKRAETSLDLSGGTLQNLVNKNAFDVPSANDLGAIIKRSKDMQLVRSGTKSALHPRSVSVPFGTQGDGLMLSDHMGFVVSYTL